MEDNAILAGCMAKFFDPHSSDLSPVVSDSQTVYHVVADESGFPQVHYQAVRRVVFFDRSECLIDSFNNVYAEGLPEVINKVKQQLVEREKINASEPSKNMWANFEPEQERQEPELKIAELTDTVIEQRQDIERLEKRFKEVQKERDTERRLRHTAEEENHDLIRALALASARMHVIRQLSAECENSIDIAAMEHGVK